MSQCNFLTFRPAVARGSGTACDDAFMADSSRKRYTVTAEPDGRFWLIRIQERPDLLTQARHAGEIELMARDVIAANDEVPSDSFDLVLPEVDDRLIAP